MATRASGRCRGEGASGRPLREQTQCLRKLRQAATGRASARRVFMLGSLRGPPVKIGTIQRRLTWPLRKEDTRKSRSVYNVVAKLTRRARWPLATGIDRNNFTTSGGPRLAWPHTARSKVQASSLLGADQS